MTKRPRDPNQLAKFIVDSATSEGHPEVQQVESAATKFARSGGLKGGKARADKLTPSRRSEIARLAASTRWKAPKDGK